MGFLSLLAYCANCKGAFTCNPLRVPSVTIKGYREPLCRECADRLNRMRIAEGLPPFPIFPDAYEPLDESEGW